MTDPPPDHFPQEATPPSPFDPEPDARAPLWFEVDDEVAPDPVEMPLWPGPAAAGPIPLADWRTAEAQAAARLGRAAAAFGALDERVRIDGAGMRRRLVLREAAEIAWHVGDRVTLDRLSLHLSDRLGQADADAPGLARAAWSVRRLDRGGPPDLSALPAFLGGAGDRANGAALPPPLADWRDRLAAAGDLHPLTQAALGWHVWQRLGLSGDAPPVEGAVLAARLGAATVRPGGGLGFCPVALAGPLALRARGGAPERLAAWYDGVANAALAGLMECDRVAFWRRDATARTARLTGRTPARLIEALSEQPVVSAPMLAAATGASRAAVQRNMARFEALGLVYELTGQARFRYWRIALAGLSAR